MRSYLEEQYDEHTAQLTIQIDVNTAQAQYLRTLKPTFEPAPIALVSTALLPAALDRTPYGLTLAGQVAACLDQGITLAHNCHGYGGMGLARGAGAEYQYGEVWDSALLPSQTFASWAAFVAWLAVQSDFSLAAPLTHNPSSQQGQAITRQRLIELVQRA